MAGGYTFTYRKILDWGWFKDPPVAHFFEYCRCKAAYAPTYYMGKEIGIGEFMASLPEMSTETGLSIQQIRRAIKCLTSTGEIECDTTDGRHRVKVTKYAEYQHVGENGTTGRTTRQPTGQQDPTYPINRKKERRKKKYTPISPKGTVKKEEETDERKYDGITYLG